MKKHVLFCLCLAGIVLVSCKNSTEKDANENNSASTEKTMNEGDASNNDILHKIAEANGLKNWDRVNEVQFTFNVDRDTAHFERSWKWWPKKEKIMMLSGKDTVSYTQMGEKKMDSTQMNADKAFTNDKYWLLFPFQLVWDDGFKESEKDNVMAPIANEPMKQVTIAYNSKDGYTPGDMYKLYIDDDYMIREWEYHPGGSKDAKIKTTWEEYTDENGIKIAKMHTNKDGSFKLYFTNVSVK